MNVFNNIVVLSEQGRRLKLQHDKANFLNCVKMIYGHLVEYGFNNITFNTKVEICFIHGVLSFDEDNDGYIDVTYDRESKLMDFKFNVDKMCKIFSSYSQETLIKFLDEFYADYEEDDEFLSWVGNENIKNINHYFN